MKRLEVHYRGWGEQWPLGTLADSGRSVLFEYSPEALRQGLELSPRNLRLRREAYSGFSAGQHRLPGLIADALPDGWGLLVTDRLFRRGGCDPGTLSPLDRLAFIGERAIGALAFAPASRGPHAVDDVPLLALAQGVRELLNDRDSAVLRQLALLGGSPHGARPKAMVQYDASSGAMSTDPAAAGTPWLVKFPARHEHKEVCAIENAYAELARRCGLSVPATRHFDLDRTLAAFGIERFDREAGLRVPMLTLAGLLDADFRMPQVDYLTFLRATSFLTGDQREVFAAYARCVFNVLFHNRDDHSKNFSYRLGRDRRYRLAPVYGVTFGEGPGGEHPMDVLGETKAPGRRHLLELAARADLDRSVAAELLDRMLAVVPEVPRLLATGVRAATRKHIVSLVEANAMRLR